MNTAVRSMSNADEVIIDVEVSLGRGHDVVVADEATLEASPAPTPHEVPRRGAGGPLAGKVAIVTGGSGAIGREIALTLAAEGARVCIVGRDVVRLRETAAAVGSKVPLVYLQCDLGSASEIDSVADFIDRFDRPVDIVVHAAGVQVAADVANGAVDDLDEQYLVNLRGPYLLSQKLLGKLQEAQGHVVFLNSTEGLHAEAGGAQFAMTKFGLRGLADSLRAEMSGTGIRVTSVFAGGVETRVELGAGGDAGDDDGVIRPSDVAGCVVQALRMPKSVQITDLRVVPSGTAR